jgi:hypothetical protein
LSLDGQQPGQTDEPVHVAQQEIGGVFHPEETFGQVVPERVGRVRDSSWIGDPGGQTIESKGYTGGPTC